MKALIYDCEIIRAIPDRNEPPIPDIQYCKGWGDHANMGVSVIGAYSYQQDRYRVFCKDNFEEFGELFRASDLAVGFNNIGFDDKLIAASNIFFDENLMRFGAVPRYDILSEVWVAAGLKPTWSGPASAGFSLDAICRCTLGETKTGNGALAPIHWQRGKIGSVIDYCLQDIKLTKRLFDLVLAGEVIENPKNGYALTLMKP